MKSLNFHISKRAMMGSDEYRHFHEIQIQKGLLARIEKVLEHELKEILESISIDDGETRKRFIKGRIENILQMLKNEHKKIEES